MENNLKYIVYCTTNTINGKIYIGVHRTDVSKFDGYIGCGIYITRPSTYERSKTVFQLAVKKYGPKNFKRITIAEFDNEDEAYSLEEYIVNKEFIKRKDVYNTTIGGTNGAYMLTCKEVYQYDEKGNFIKTFSSMHEAARVVDRHVTSIARAITLKCKCASYFWTEIKYDKLDLSKMKQYIGLHTIPVFQYANTGEYECCYDSIKDCARVLHKSDSNISNAIRLGTLCYDKYFSSIYKPQYCQAKTEKIKTTKIYQYDLEGNFIAEYSGMPEAKKKLNIKSDIYKAIRLKRTAGGFQWSFEKLDKMSPVQPKSGKAMKVGKYDKNWNLIKEYPTLTACKRENGVGLEHVLRGRDQFHKGFRYKYLS